MYIIHHLRNIDSFYREDIICDKLWLSGRKQKLAYFELILYLRFIFSFLLLNVHRAPTYFKGWWFSPFSLQRILPSHLAGRLHGLLLCRWARPHPTPRQRLSCGPFGWVCRIHQLHLCRGVIPLPKRVSWIQNETTWWWGSSEAVLLGNAENPFIAITPRSTLARSVSTW